jgi:hypothetical protein
MLNVQYKTNVGNCRYHTNIRSVDKTAVHIFKACDYRALSNPPAHTVNKENVSQLLCPDVRPTSPAPLAVAGLPNQTLPPARPGSPSRPTPKSHAYSQCIPKSQSCLWPSSSSIARKFKAQKKYKIISHLYF